MGRSDGGSLCPVHCQRRVSVGATKPSTLSHRSHSNELVSRHRALSVSASGNNDPAGQESDRGIRSTVALPRILQPNMFGSQDRRVLPTGIRLEILEPICPKGEVQNDHSQNSDKCDAQGGLGCEYRSERRILSYPYSRSVQASAAVRRSNKRRAPRFSIQSPTVRSDLCPTGVYQGNSSRGAPCAFARCLPSSVPRRLATKKSKQVAVGSANKLVARHHSSCGVCAKRAQVAPSSHSTSDTHRCRISSGPRSDVPTDEPRSKVRRQDRNTSLSVGHDSLFLAVPPRTIELSDRCNSARQVASQTSATIFAGSLGSSVENSQGTDPSEARLVGPSSPMVVGQEVHQSRSAAGCSRGSSTSIHRCVRVGLGSPFGRPPDEWELVDEGGHSTHQSLGNVGGSVRPTGLPSTADRSYGTTDVGQFLGGFVHTKAGGNGVCAAVSSYSRGSAPGAGRTDHSSGQTHSRRSECSGRPAVQNEQNSAHGMDPSPVSVQVTWDTPNMDLFATRLNNRLPVFVSPMADPLAVDVDAMSMSWKGMYAYAFPPFVMLGRVLEKVLKDHPCEMILVAPKWPNQSWYARLLELLVDFPLVLPLREDLLFQPHNHQRHRSLPAVCLHAWRLSSDPLQREGFRRQLPIRSHAVVGNPPERSMTANGGSSLVGVLSNRWIRSRLLFRNWRISLFFSFKLNT